MVVVLQTQFFIRFQKAHPEVIVGERSFRSLKPFFIKAMKERNTCCCIYHVELNELRIALNKYHATRPKEHLCQHGMESGSCEASSIEFEGLTSLWESVVCPKVNLTSGMTSNAYMVSVVDVVFRSSLCARTRKKGPTVGKSSGDGLLTRKPSQRKVES